MIPVSNEFREKMQHDTSFRQQADVTLANGVVLNLRERDFTLKNNGVSEGAGVTGLPLGIAVCRCIQIELMNDNEQFSDYDFYGAKIHLYLTYQLARRVEKIDYGFYTVTTPETYGATVIITAFDDMHKADRLYDTNLIYPASLGEILADACVKCGINQGDITFTNHDYIVNEKPDPENTTYRAVIGYIAMFAGGNARIDMNGYLRIKEYTFNHTGSVVASLDGGNFDYNLGDVADGGNFTDYSSGDSYDGGWFTERSYVVLNSWKNLKIETDDVLITGIRDKESKTQVGQDGYVIEVNNPLMAGDVANALALVGDLIIGARTRPFSGDCVANPIVEFMDDVILHDRKGNTYLSVVTDVNFMFLGYTTLKNSSTSALRHQSAYSSDATEAVRTSKELVNEEKTERERAVQQLATIIGQSSGLYMTTEEQQDHSVIYYMHDKPTLAQSMVIWRLSANAFAISTDGGLTYPYGIDSSGQAILNKIYVQGINADYINSGHMSADHIRGGDLVLGGLNDINGKIKIYNSQNEETATISKDGIEYYGAWSTMNGIPFRPKVTINDSTIKFKSPVGTTGDEIDWGETVFEASGGGLDVSTQYNLTFNSSMLGFFGGNVSTKAIINRDTSNFYIQQLQNILVNFGLAQFV